MTREEVEKYTILRVPCGSTLPGLNIPGKDDRDEMGVCIEPAGMALSFTEFDQYIYRSAAEREGKHDAPSQPGDLDLTIYSLKKFLRLAMQGNPQLVQLLFIPKNMQIVSSDLGDDLQGISSQIISKQAGCRYLGYLEAQRQRLLGERGQKKVNRPELEEKYGFDTKYAMHILRLGFQGVELMSTGKLTFPMSEVDRAFCYATRLGEVPLNDVLSKAGELERTIKDLIKDGPLAEKPNYALVEDWMVHTYLNKWRKNEVQ